MYSAPDFFVVSFDASDTFASVCKPVYYDSQFSEDPVVRCQVVHELVLGSFEYQCYNTDMG